MPEVKFFINPYSIAVSACSWCTIKQMQRQASSLQFHVSCIDVADTLMQAVAVYADRLVDIKTCQNT
jgi:hypothetical protein